MRQQAEVKSVSVAETDVASTCCLIGRYWVILKLPSPFKFIWSLSVRNRSFGRWLVAIFILILDFECIPPTARGKGAPWQFSNFRLNLLIRFFFFQEMGAHGVLPIGFFFPEVEFPTASMLSRTYYFLKSSLTWKPRGGVKKKELNFLFKIYQKVISWPSVWLVEKCLLDWDFQLNLHFKCQASWPIKIEK